MTSALESSTGGDTLGAGTGQRYDSSHPTKQEPLTMASLHAREARIAAGEARLRDVEGGYGDTLYRLRRESVATQITLNRVAAQLGVQVASNEEVDAVLDSEE